MTYRGMMAMIAAWTLAFAAPSWAQEDESDEPAGPKPEEVLFGSFAAGENTLTFEDNPTPSSSETYRLTGPDGAELSRGLYLVFEGDQVVLVDLDGDANCPASQRGRYRFMMGTDDTGAPQLSLLEVREACRDRLERLNAEPAPDAPLEIATQDGAADGAEAGEDADASEGGDEAEGEDETAAEDGR